METPLFKLTLARTQEAVTISMPFGVTESSPDELNKFILNEASEEFHLYAAQTLFTGLLDIAKTKLHIIYDKSAIPMTWYQTAPRILTNAKMDINKLLNQGVVFTAPSTDWLSQEPQFFKVSYEFEPKDGKPVTVRLLTLIRVCKDVERPNEYSFVLDIHALIPDRNKEFYQTNAYQKEMSKVYDLLNDLAHVINQRLAIKS